MNESEYALCADVYYGRIDNVHKILGEGRDMSLPFLLACREEKPNILQLITSRAFIPPSCAKYGLSLCPNQSMVQTICRGLITSTGQTSTQSIVNVLRTYEQNKYMRRAAAFKAGVHILIPRFIKEGVLTPQSAKEFTDYKPRLDETVLAGAMDIGLSLVDISDIIIKKGVVYAATEFSKIFPSRVPYTFLNEFQRVLIRRFNKRGVTDIEWASMWLSHQQGKPRWYKLKYEFWFAAAFHFILYNQFLSKEQLMSIKTSNISNEALKHIMEIQIEQLSAKVNHRRWENMRNSLYSHNYNLFVSLFRDMLMNKVHDVATYMFWALSNPQKFPRWNFLNHLEILYTALDKQNGKLSVGILQRLFTPRYEKDHAFRKRVLGLSMKNRVDEVMMFFAEKELIPKEYESSKIRAMIRLRKRVHWKGIYPKRKFTSYEYLDALNYKNKVVVDIVNTYPIDSVDPVTFEAICRYGVTALQEKYISSVKQMGAFTDWFTGPHKVMSYLVGAIESKNVDALKFVYDNFSFTPAFSGDSNRVLLAAIKFPNFDMIRILATIHRDVGNRYFLGIPSYEAFKPLTREKADLYIYIRTQIPIGNDQTMGSHMESFLVNESSVHVHRIIHVLWKLNSSLMNEVVTKLFSQREKSKAFVANLHMFPALYEQVPAQLKLRSAVWRSIKAPPEVVANIKKELVESGILSTPGIDVFGALRNYTDYTNIPEDIRILLLRKSKPRGIYGLEFLVRIGIPSDIHAYFTIENLNFSNVDSLKRLMNLIFTKKDTFTLSKLIEHPTTNIHTILSACITRNRVDMFTFVIQTARGGNYMKSNPRYFLLHSLANRNFTLQSLIIGTLYKETSPDPASPDSLLFILFSVLFNSLIFPKLAIKNMPPSTWPRKIPGLGNFLPNILYIAISTYSHDNVALLLSIKEVRSSVDVTSIIKYLTSEREREQLIDSVFRDVVSSELRGDTKYYRDKFELYQEHLSENNVKGRLKSMMHSFLRRGFFNIQTNASFYMKEFLKDPSSHHLFEAIYEYVTKNQRINFAAMKDVPEIRRLYNEYLRIDAQREMGMDVDD